MKNKKIMKSKTIVYCYLLCLGILFLGGCGSKNSNVKSSSSADKVSVQTSTEEKNDKIYILETEQISEVKEIDYYVQNECHKSSEKDKMQEICEELCKIKLDNVVPEENMVEGFLDVEILLKDGTKITFGCNDKYIAFGNQYEVENNLYNMITE